MSTATPEPGRPRRDRPTRKTPPAIHGLGTPAKSIAFLRTCLGLALLLPAIAHADWQRDYIRGRDALDRGNLAEAQRLMEAAIGERPAPSASERMGRVPQPYLPQLYLGIVLSRQGDCGRAVGLLRDAAMTPILARLPRETGLRDTALRACGADGATTPPPAPPATPEPVAPPTTPAAPPAIPEPAAPAPAPPPDPWLSERADIRNALQAYTRDAGFRAPAADRFQSPRARQWALLLSALAAARAAGTEPDGSPAQNRNAAEARRQLQAAAAIGALPNWQSLASPRQREFLR